MFWTSCPPKSIGRGIHFLYYYCGLNVAETAKIHLDEDRPFWDLGGEDIAHFTHDDDGNPVFAFEGPSADYYAEAQRRKREEAVEAVSWRPRDDA